MNINIEIWNSLHDGEITVGALEGDTLVLFVAIPYIRERILPLGDSFILRLKGFRSAVITDVDKKKKSSDWADLFKSGIEILYADSESMPVKIAVTSGFITLDFDTIEITTDTGRGLAYSEIERASASFWEEWTAKAKNPQKYGP